MKTTKNKNENDSRIDLGCRWNKGIHQYLFETSFSALDKRNKNILVAIVGCQFYVMRQNTYFENIMMFMGYHVNANFWFK